MKKGISKKTALGFFKIYKYTFLIFEKGDKQKNCDSFFKIYKYIFLIFEKGDKQKIAVGLQNL